MNVLETKLLLHVDFSPALRSGRSSGKCSVFPPTKRKKIVVFFCSNVIAAAEKENRENLSLSLLQLALSGPDKNSRRLLIHIFIFDIGFASKSYSIFCVSLYLEFQSDTRAAGRGAESERVR